MCRSNLKPPPFGVGVITPKGIVPERHRFMLASPIGGPALRRVRRDERPFRLGFLGRSGDEMRLLGCGLNGSFVCGLPWFAMISHCNPKQHLSCNTIWCEVWPRFVGSCGQGALGQGRENLGWIPTDALEVSFPRTLQTFKLSTE